MKYLIWKRKILKPDNSGVYDSMIINIKKNWYHATNIKEHYLISRVEYHGILPELLDEIYEEFMYYKLDIDDEYIEALKSKDSITSKMAYISIMCLKNKTRIYKNELKIIFKKMRER